MKGTLLNTATVAVGASIGLLVGRYIPVDYRDVALHGLGLVVLGIGVKMFLKSHNPLISAIAVAVGGILGLWIGIDAGIGHLSEWLRSQTGGEAGRFNEGLITSFVLFCIGPMTLIGCVKDGLEGDIELLALKSTLDGIASIFLAAAFGPGVLVTAALVLVFQGALTLCARPLKPLADNPTVIDEVTAAGGAIMLGIGIGLLGLKDLHTANYLPALVLAPLAGLGFKKMENAKVKA